jgi:hypothetical protein
MSEYNEESMKQRATKIEQEVDRIQRCIASRSDHYQVLNVNRNAPIETIRQSYCRAVELLHPLKCQDITVSDGALRWKLSQVFLRVVEAFAALSHPGRRAQYDSEINRRPIVPLPMPALPIVMQSREEALEVLPLRTTPLPSRPAAGRVTGPLQEPTPGRAKERRRSARLAITVPVRVTSIRGNWREVTESKDVSRTGIRIHLKHEVEEGEELKLEIPMPLALRDHSHNESLYTVFAKVRNFKPSDSGGFLVGIEFE